MKQVIGWAAAAMIVNDSDKTVPLTVSGIRPETCRITDEKRTNEKIALPSELPPHAFIAVLE